MQLRSNLKDMFGKSKLPSLHKKTKKLKSVTKSKVSVPYNSGKKIRTKKAGKTALRRKRT